MIFWEPGNICMLNTSIFGMTPMFCFGILRIWFHWMRIMRLDQSLKYVQLKVFQWLIWMTIKLLEETFFLLTTYIKSYPDWKHVLLSNTSGWWSHLTISLLSHKFIIFFSNIFLPFLEVFFGATFSRSFVLLILLLKYCS